MTTQKELAELPDFQYASENGALWNRLSMESYGLKCAAHARELALEEVREAIESANARRVLYVPDCIDVIEALKGK